MELINKLMIDDDTDEYHLIRMWQRKHNNDIALYFFNKYKDETLNIVYQKINNKFSSIPFEKNDLFHIFWDAILKTLKIFDFKKGSTVRSLLITKTYWMTLREVEKFLHNSELVLTTAYSYEKLFEKNSNFNLGKNGKNGINITYSDVTKKFIDEVISFNEEYDIKTLKKVIYLRSLGYSSKQISSKLRIKIYFINRMIKFICRIAKKLYD